MSKCLEMSVEEFAQLGWPDQCNVLRELDNCASRCEGKTPTEADRKRVPYLKQERLFRAIHEKQKNDWINQGVTQ